MIRPAASGTALSEPVPQPPRLFSVVVPPCQPLSISRCPFCSCDHNSSIIIKLRLADNGLQGTLTQNLGLLDGLKELVIYGNKGLTGTIPEQLTRLSELEKLYLHYNGLSGTVPSLSSMQRLHGLHIGGNSGAGLHGGLEWLGELQALEEVLLWDNSFHGPLPESMRTMSSLKSLELGNNPLNCELPSWLGELGNLTEVSAYDDGLIGHFPESLGGVTQPHLKRFFMRDNQISGTLHPAMLANLTALMELALHGNQLSGSLPATLGEMPSLETLMLGGNKLSGSLPAALSAVPSLGKLSLSGNAFTTMDVEMARPPFLSDPRHRWVCQLGSNPWACPIAEWAQDDCKARCDDQKGDNSTTTGGAQRVVAGVAVEN